MYQGNSYRKRSYSRHMLNLHPFLDTGFPLHLDDDLPPTRRDRKAIDLFVAAVKLGHGRRSRNSPARRWTR